MRLTSSENDFNNVRHLERFRIQILLVYKTSACYQIAPIGVPTSMSISEDMPPFLSTVLGAPSVTKPYSFCTGGCTLWSILLTSSCKSHLYWPHSLPLMQRIPQLCWTQCRFRKHQVALCNSHSLVLCSRKLFKVNERLLCLSFLQYILKGSDDGV
jgi:hypothetical protein